MTAPLRRAALAACLVAAPGACLPAPAVAGEPVLLANYTMEPPPGDPKKIADAGPLHIDGAIIRDGVTYAEGRNGSGLHFDGTDAKALVKPAGLVDRVGPALTVTAWVKLEALPPRGRWAAIVTKRVVNGDNPFALGIGDQGQLLWQSYNGVQWRNVIAKAKLSVGIWQHVAATFDAARELTLWIDGNPVARMPVDTPLLRDHEPLVLGWDPNGGASLHGTLDDLRIYATALDAGQLGQDMGGPALAGRTPSEADFPDLGYPVQLSLGRFGQPLAFQTYLGRRFQTPERKPGPDAVDWPALKLNGTIPLFEKGPSQMVEVRLLSQAEAKEVFRTPKDNVVTPVNQWFRANKWLFNRNFVYTTDATARGGSGTYELWAFPVTIAGEGESDVRNVILRLGGETIYRRDEPLHSLTLLLPANLNGAPYELTVDGRGPVSFDAGLCPVVPGHPADAPIEVNASLPGPGPRITVAGPGGPASFPNPKEWDADLAAMKQGVSLFQPPAETEGGFARYLGLRVPRGPVEVFTASMRAGMSGGHYFQPGHIAGFSGTPEAYAAHLQDNGYDFAVDDAVPRTLDADADFEWWIAAMEKRGLRVMANPDIPGNLGTLANPNLAFQSAYLPEFGAPLYREVQLLAQRFGRYPGFAGLFVGADNAAYLPYWDWAPTNPDRPWGRAYLRFQAGRDPSTPLGPGLRPSEAYERRGSEKEFVDYLHRYDETWGQYGYFVRALREILPRGVLTTGSFGSAAGGGGSGGWPAATVPGRQMSRELPVQTAYDWNELSSSLPLHNVALVDCLRSYDPEKPTWSLIDDFALHLGREARQRTYALTLTRGVRAVGTNFLAHETADPAQVSGQLQRFGETPRPRGPVIAEQKELYGWIHKYGGAYAEARPLAPVGILYVVEQGCSRPVTGAKAELEERRKGSHEGKTTEALFLCHMAGWPARIVTPEELRRGLPPEMKALLLTGLNRFDATWAWYDGLEPALRKFVEGGGRIVLDDESVVPDGVAATPGRIRVAAYSSQSPTDVSPLLFERNRDNAEKLRAALAGLPRPAAVSDRETIWTVPHRNGDVEYVTAVNWACDEGQNASLAVKPQAGRLTWNTDRPIYDVQAGRRLTAGEAASVDLTKDAFRLYALPPAPVAAPKVSVAAGAGGFAAATVDVGARGVPVQVEIAASGKKAVVSGESGAPIALPVGPGDGGTYAVRATELLTGQAAETTVTLSLPPMPPDDAEAGRLARFAERKDVPLVVALTPEQAADAGWADAAGKAAAYYAARGRRVETRRIAPGDVVTSLQPLRSIQRYPQWSTVAADLVLLGTPADNLLLFDQARGGLLSGKPGAAVTYSPFVGEYQALNLVAPDAAAAAALVQGLAPR